MLDTYLDTYTENYKKKYEETQTDINSKIGEKLKNTYKDCFYVKGPTELIFGLMCAKQNNYDSITSSIIEEFPDDGKLKLSRNFDFYTGKFKVSLLPGEEIKSASLVIKVPFPKDEELLEYWLNHDCSPPNNPELLDRLNKNLGDTRKMSDINGWVFYEKLISTKDVVIKTVPNVNNCFNFDFPIYIDPYVVAYIYFEKNNIYECGLPTTFVQEEVVVVDRESLHLSLTK